MKTLEITARDERGNVTICETEEIGIPVNENLPPVLRRTTVDSYLAGIARERGLDYPAPDPLLVSALAIAESLAHHGFREFTVTEHGPGLGVTLAIPAHSVSLLLKPVIRGIALQFARPGWSWEMRVPEADRTASAVAGLVLLARMPA